MKKIGRSLVALLVLSLLLTGCGDREKKPKKTEPEEAAPTVPLLTQEKNSSETQELPAIPSVPEASPNATAAKPPVTAAKPPVTTAKPPVTTSHTADGIELPDHQWK